MAKQLEPAASPFERRPQQNRARAGWVGWFRRGSGRWQKVVEAQTERECWQLLSDYKEPNRIECDRCVLKAGVAPPPIRSQED